MTVRRALAALTAVTLLLRIGCSVEPTAGGDGDGDAAGEAPSVRLVEVATGLGAPISMVATPDGNRTYLLDQLGTATEVLPDGGGLATTPYLDVGDRIVGLSSTRDDERGLLGMAFHPYYSTNKRVFAFFTERPPAGAAVDHINVLSEFRATADGSAVDPATEQVLWRSEQELDSHAAGQLLFAPDTRLLLFLGDGEQGSATAQDPTSPYGKVLRLDVDSAPGSVSAAPGNPAEPGALPEIWAGGLRHPWRVSFDPDTKRILVAEPSFTARSQEVNLLERGANYGWELPMSRECWPGDGREADPSCLTSAAGAVLTPPVAEYGTSLGLIVSGAHIYRGDAVPALRDLLVMTEWGFQSGGGALLAAPADGDPPWRPTRVRIDGGKPPGANYFWSLSRDADGELYVGTMAGRAPAERKGRLFRVVAA